MKIRLDSFLIKLHYLAVFCIVAAQPLGMSGVISLLFAGTFVLTAVFWLVMAQRKLDAIGLLGLLIIMLVCINVGLNAVLTNTNISFDYFKKVIMFSMTILFFSAVVNYKPLPSDVTLIFRGNTLLILYLAAMYFLRNDAMHVFNGLVTNYLTFGFENPNKAAAFLLCIFTIEVIQIYMAPRWRGRLVHLATSGIVLFFLIAAKARTSLLAAAFLLGILLLYRIRPKWNLSMRKWMAAGIAVFPIVFALVYLAWVDEQWFQEMFSFAASEGKDLTAREQIWQSAMAGFKVSPLIGAYSQISRGIGMSQYHNTHVDTLASYGVVVLVLFCLFLYLVLCKGGRNSEGKLSNLSLYAFACVLILGVGEAMLVSGGTGIYICAGVLLMLTNHEFGDRRRKYANRISK